MDIMEVSFKATIDRDALHSSLTRMKRIAARSTYPICEHVRLQVSPDEIILLATNLDLWLRDVLSCQSDGEFTITLHCRDLAALVSKAPKGSVITVNAGDGGPVTVTTAAGIISQMSNLPPEDFPMAAAPKGQAFTFVITADTWREIATGVAYAISTEEIRYYLNGIHMAPLKGGKLQFQATDGHRMGRLVIDASCPPDMPGVIIPRFTIAELTKAIGKKGADDLSVTLQGDQVTFHLGTLLFTSKLINGVFPDVDRIIPKCDPGIMTGELTLDPALISDAVKTLAGYGKGRAMVLSLNSSIELSVKSGDTELERTALTIPGEWTGDDYTFGVNITYFVEMLAAMRGKVKITTSGAINPILIQDEGQPGAVHVLMPVRI